MGLNSDKTSKVFCINGMKRHRRLDGVQVHSAKGDVSGQRAMEEEDTGTVSCCRQPSEEEGRLERERERRERERYSIVE